MQHSERVRGGDCDVPVVDWISIAVHALPSDARVGLLATRGTLAAEIYTNAIETSGRIPIMTTGLETDAVMNVIYGSDGVKAGRRMVVARSTLLAVARSLESRGAQRMLLGCTELPLLIPASSRLWPVPAHDPAVSVARYNVAYLVGNSPLRILGLGWEKRAPSVAEMANMRSALQDALAEGAFGLSTGLDYPPGAHASTEELIKLAEVVATAGGIYHTHVRYQLGDGFLDPFREALTIGERAECPVHLTHLYRRTSAKGGSAPLPGLLEDAWNKGPDVTFDTYPSEWSGTRLPMLLPLWVQGGSPDQIRDRLTNAGLRERIPDHVDRRGDSYAGSNPWDDICLGGFRHEENKNLEGASLGEIMRQRGLCAADAIIELLITEDFGITQSAPGPHGASIPTFLRHRLGMVGSDSVFVGDYPSPRSYGTFPRVLGEFVREERTLNLEDAVRKMTSMPANRLGLPDRGLLRNGLKADIVVFDEARVKHRATYREPRLFPEGIHHVFVNGEPTVLDARPTGRLPGRALRRGATS